MLAAAGVGEEAEEGAGNCFILFSYLHKDWCGSSGLLEMQSIVTAFVHYYDTKGCKSRYQA
jgi:hypothetical protein